MAAATAWDELATELDTRAALSSVISRPRRGVAGAIVGVDGGRGRAYAAWMSTPPHRRAGRRTGNGRGERL